MASQGFTFPPPPPPPPPASSGSSLVSHDGLPTDWRSRGRGQGGFQGRGFGSNRHNPSRGGAPGRGAGSHSRGGFTRGWDHERRGRGGFQDGPSRGQKRRHDQAFSKNSQAADRPATPPQVPSFGFDLNSMIPQTASQSSKKATSPKKQAQPPTRNLFGLAPSFDDHDSEPEEDEEEEQNLGQNQRTKGAALQVTYGGRTYNLDNPQELAAWIAERKKKFPTEAKAEEAKAKAKETAERRAAERAAKAKGRASSSKKKARSATKTKRSREDEGGVPLSAESERLQRELEAAKRRIQELEKAQDALQATNEVAKSLSDHNDQTLPGGASEEVVIVLGAAQEAEKTHLSIKNGNVDGQQRLTMSRDGDNIDNSLQSKHDADTSSSGTSSEGEYESESEDNEAPIELPSKRRSTVDKEAQPRERPKCRDFERHGRCPRGRRCHFKHEPVKGGPNNRAANDSSKDHGRVGGKSLYQRLQEEQEEMVDELVLQHILYLGDHGFLEDQPTAQHPE